MKSNNFSDDMVPVVFSTPTVPEKTQIANQTSINSEILPSTSPNPIGLEHFEEIVTGYVRGAKKAGAKGIRLNCLLSGDIIF